MGPWLRSLVGQMGTNVTKVAEGPKIVFYAKDVAALRETLVARGASFGKVREGEFFLCDGKDPDGNPIQLSSR